jgi:hypothetical protein
LAEKSDPLVHKNLLESMRPPETRPRTEAPAILETSISDSPSSTSTFSEFRKRGNKRSTRFHIALLIPSPETRSFASSILALIRFLKDSLRVFQDQTGALRVPFTATRKTSIATVIYMP